MNAATLVMRSDMFIEYVKPGNGDERWNHCLLTTVTAYLQS